MKIVILDGYALNPGDLTWDPLEELGDLTVYDRTEEHLILERIKDADFVYTNKTPLTKETINACSKLKWIGVLATGYNVVDVSAARAKNIPVCNVPTYGTNAVSQYVFALLLELCHNVGHHSKAVNEGRWNQSKDFCFWDFPLVELVGKTIGIIGLGRIGQQTAKIAQAFGMKVLANDHNENSELVSDTLKYCDLDELYRQADVISLHCPLFDSTNGMINKNTIEVMKDGVMIINTSRGPLIVEEDMFEALDSGKIAGYACDVVSTEPILSANPLLKAKNCLITPHIAWAPLESRARLLDTAINNLKSFVNGITVNEVK